MLRHFLTLLLKHKQMLDASYRNEILSQTPLLCFFETSGSPSTSAIFVKYVGLVHALTILSEIYVEHLSTSFY